MPTIFGVLFDDSMVSFNLSFIEASCFLGLYPGELHHKLFYPSENALMLLSILRSSLYLGFSFLHHCSEKSQLLSSVSYAMTWLLKAFLRLLGSILYFIDSELNVLIL